MTKDDININVLSIFDGDWDPHKGYVVVCDETNNPPSVIDAGKLNVDIYVKGVRDV